MIKPRNKLELIDLLLTSRTYHQRLRYHLKTNENRQKNDEQLAYSIAKHINAINEMVDHLRASRDTTFAGPPEVPPPIDG